AMGFRELKLRKSPDCPLCGPNPTITGLIDYDAFCGVGRGDEAAQATSADIGVKELAERRAAGDELELLDVREPHEWDICHIEGAKLLPLSTLTEHMHELDPAKSYAIHCKTGARSAKAVALLQKAGFKRVRNVAGGILAWAREVD